MLRFLTAGESHGQTLVMTAGRDASGSRDRHRRPERPTPSSPGRLRPRTADADRKRPRRDHRGRSPRAYDRRPDRPAHSQPRLGQLAADDARRARDAGRRDWQQAVGCHAAAAGTRRSRRRDQIRPHRRARCARTRQRPRNGGARGRRIAGAPTARAVRRPDHQSRVGHRRNRPAGDHGRCRSRKRRRSPETLRCDAWTRACSRR